MATSSVISQEKKSLDSDAANPFFDQTVIGFVHVNLEKTDAGNVQMLLKKLELDFLPASKALTSGKPLVNAVRNSLLELKVSELLVLVSVEEFGEMPIILLPVTDDNREKVRGMLATVSNEQLGLHVIGDRYLMIGSEKTAQRIRESRFELRRDAEKLNSLPGDSAISFHLAFSSDQRRVVRELFPNLPAPFQSINGKLLADDVQTISLSVESFEPHVLKLSLRASNDESARRVEEAISIVTADESPESLLAVVQPRLKQFHQEHPLQQDRNTLTLELSEERGDIDALMKMLNPLIQEQRERIALEQDQYRLHRIAFGLHNYHDQKKSFPAYANVDEAGKPLLSWRVHILPYMGEKELYKKFRLDEPWDSEHNKALIVQMPDIYRSAQDSDDAIGKTRYQSPYGKGLFLEGKTARSFKDLIDGTSNIIMTAQVLPSHSVIWTQPGDWNVNLENPKAGLFDDKRSRTNIGRGDGSTSSMSNATPDETLRHLLTIDGRESIDEGSIK